MKIKHFWIWLAGFTDGEGTFGIYKWKYLNHPIRLYPRIQWANNNKKTLKFIKENAKINNKIVFKKVQSNFTNRNYGVNQKQIYILFVSKKDDCLRIAKNLLPYLKIKKNKAKQLIKFLKR